jgi:acetoin utilization protein AcuB
MQVSTRMTRRPITVSPEATLRQASDLMTKNDVRHLPVVKSRELVGIITERDILAVTSQDAASRVDLDRHVSDFMTSSVITISPETSLERAARLFRKHHIAGLPVLRGNRLVGMITERDLLGAFVQVASHHTPRARIELTVPRKPEHFHRICQLITEHGGQLMRSERHLRVNDPGLDVILKVASSLMDPIVEAIESAGYEIDLIVYEC